MMDWHLSDDTVAERRGVALFGVDNVNDLLGNGSSGEGDGVEEGVH